MFCRIGPAVSFDSENIRMVECSFEGDSGANFCILGWSLHVFFKKLNIMSGIVSSIIDKLVSSHVFVGSGKE